MIHQKTVTAELLEIGIVLVVRIYSIQCVIIFRSLRYSLQFKYAATAVTPDELKTSVGLGGHVKIAPQLYAHWYFTVPV